MEYNIPVDILPKGWEMIKLGELSEVLDSKRMPINSEEREKRIIGKREEELFPYYGATGQVGLIDDYLLDGEFILLGEDGAPFLDVSKEKAYIVDGKIWVNNYAHIIRVFGSSGSNKYLCHFLNQFNYKEYVTGTTRLKLNQSSMRNILIKLAPLPEQNRIVSKIEELFSDLDKGIEQLKTAQQQLKVYRQAVLKWAFEGKLTEEWRKTHHVEPAGKLLELIKEEREKQYQQKLEKWQRTIKEWESKGKEGKKPAKPKKQIELPSLTEDELAELPQLPKGWCWVKVGEIANIVRGGSPRPAGDPKYFGGNIPWITVAELTKDEKVFLFNVSQFVKSLGKEKSRYIEPNTLLLTNSGATLGVPKITKIGGCINDGSVALLELNMDLKFYLYWFLKSITKNLRSINQGAAQPNLNTNIVREIKFPLCPFNEQSQIVQEIETRLSVCDNIEVNIEESLQKAEALRQSILKKAFEGKLVPQDPNEEPAHILLERIRAEKANQGIEKKKSNNRKKRKLL